MSGAATAEPTTGLPPTIPGEAFELAESVVLREDAVLDPVDRTVPLHIIRPCVGRGKGRHVYEADMLRENAHKFTGWKMYLNHRSPAAEKAAGGLPRDVQEYAGRVLEAKWDPDVPADPAQGYGQGAVVGKVRPVLLARQLIEEDPGALEASINARATSVRPVTRDGGRAWLVEGIEDRGSVDFVTEGGAGGRVASLLEAAYHDAHYEEKGLLEAMDDTQLLEHLRETRPEFLRALGIQEGATLQPPAPSTPPAPPETPTPGREAETPGGEMSASPAEVLREALGTDEGREALDGILNERIEEALSTERERFDERLEVARAEARADSDRQIQLRDLRDEAHSQIKEAKLPPAFMGELLGRFKLSESGQPTPELNVFDEVDDETGAITKPAKAVLREAVDGAIKRSRELIEAASPTRVTGQGAGAGGDGGEDPAGGGGGEAAKGDEPLWKRSLREAGVDPDEAYKD